MIALYLSLAIFFEENIRAGVFSKIRFQKNAKAGQGAFHMHLSIMTSPLLAHSRCLRMTVPDFEAVTTKEALQGEDRAHSCPTRHVENEAALMAQKHSNDGLARGGWPANEKRAQTARFQVR
jgi:hypothetical protein